MKTVQYPPPEILTTASSGCTFHFISISNSGNWLDRLDTEWNIPGIIGTVLGFIQGFLLAYLIFATH